MSAVKGPLEKSGKYIDSLIKEMVFHLPSYVKNTGDVLNKLDQLNVPVGARLVGIDVETLYTSIPHQWGLKAAAHFLELDHPLLGAHNQFVLELWEFMLTHHFFPIFRN